MRADRLQSILVNKRAAPETLMFMLHAQSVHLFHRTTNMSLTAPDFQLRSVITSSTISRGKRGISRDVTNCAAFSVSVRQLMLTSQRNELQRVLRSLYIRAR
jgi:hypothetical protein